MEVKSEKETGSQTSPTMSTAHEDVYMLPTAVR